MSDELNNYTAVGNEELGDKKKRAMELWDEMESQSEEENTLKNDSTSMKFLSLVLSRGKTEGGKLVKCCGSTYILLEKGQKCTTCKKELEGKR